MKRTRSTLLSLAVGTLLASTSGAAWAADPTTPDAGDYPATNTGRNLRDRDDRALTPTDQSEKPADRELSQKIRKAVTADDTLSITAHNVKIITVNGVVTLRGPVKSQRERNAIAAKAKSVAGVKKVDNKLEIAASDRASGSSKE
jgi:hyperosmotically inducible periplasmic protein